MTDKPITTLTVEEILFKERVGKLQKEKVYVLYHNIFQRCYNPNNKDFDRYGGRGITMCYEFCSSFMLFFNYISTLKNYQEWRNSKRVYSLDRIKNDLGYDYGNLRFTTQSVQCGNQAIKSTNKSGYRCVSLKKDMNKWEATITLQKKKIFIGYYDTSKQAAISYNNYVVTNNIDRPLNIIQNG